MKKIGPIGILISACLLAMASVVGITVMLGTRVASPLDMGASYDCSCDSNSRD